MFAGGWCLGRGWHAVGVGAPRAVQERALFRTQSAGPRALDFAGHAQPVLRMREITERDEGGAAVGGVGGALFECRARDARLATGEHLVCLHVAAFAV